MGCMDQVTVLSFEQFFRHEYAGLVALGAWLTGDWSGGEDLAQEALSTAHRRWSTVGAYDQPGRFVRRVMVNLASNERRRRGRERRAVLRVRPDPVPGPEIDDGSWDRDDLLWRELDSLSTQQRTALALRYVDELPTSVIAETMECSEATVRVHLHRARQHLAERLGSSYAEELEPADMKEVER